MVNINPVTDLIARTLGMNVDDNGDSSKATGNPTKAEIKEANDNVSSAFGLKDIDLFSSSPNLSILF